MKTTFIGLLLLAGCQSVPESQTVVYQGASREENAQAIVSISKCLPQPECEELLGDRLECGPFLWRQLNVPTLTNVTSYTLPQNVASGWQDVTWEGRRCTTRGEARMLWQAFEKKIPQESLRKVRTLDKEECRIYSTLVPGEIREPVFILEGGGHKILMQISNGKLSYIDDFHNVVVRD